MPITLANVAFHKSTAVNGSDISLGGAVSSVLVSQTSTQPTIVTGVYISSVVGNNPGSATISYSPSSQMIGWKPPGSLDTFWSQPISTDGTYTVGNYATGVVVVNVTLASLPSAYKVEAVAITTPMHNVFGPVTALMALTGDIRYSCIYFKNNHPTLTATDVRLYIHSQPSLPQIVAIGVDPVGVGDGTVDGVAQVVADAVTAPTGVVFSSPVLAANGIQLGNIPPGKVVSFWQRRTVPPMSYGPLAISRYTVGVALVG